MELIIKPTELCNFKCTFCSSPNISDEHTKILDLKYVEDFLKRFPATNTIIVNGGDPLMVPVKYYWDLIELLDKLNSNATISFTSNLWDFKLKPNKWVDLFRHERIGIATSFNYGGTRLITSTREYTEDDFWEVSDMMLDLVGYRPDFISVIDNNNFDRAIDHVLLAKKMDVECKLNKAVVSGRQQDFITKAKMYELYTTIYELGLSEWEHNTKDMLRAINKGATICPIARDCDKHIRTIHPDGSYYSCGSFADDNKYPISFDSEVLNAAPVATPVTNDITTSSMKVDCWSCPMFDLCNGCRKDIRDTMDAGKVEEHCSIMKSNAQRIINAAAKCLSQ